MYNCNVAYYPFAFFLFNICYLKYVFSVFNMYWIVIYIMLVLWLPFDSHKKTNVQAHVKNNEECLSMTNTLILFFPRLGKKGGGGGG